jgi:hypothetical protein
MATGTAIALGAALGTAFGASNGDLAMSVAFGTGAGAILEFAVHIFKLVRRKREQATS